MKTRILIALVSAWCALDARSGDIGPMPEDKQPVEVGAEERNPFGKRVVKTAEPVIQNAETEETKIRGVIEKLPFEGFTHGAAGTKALIGSFVLAEGSMVPPVLQDQTERLTVLLVTPTDLELGFIEKDGSTGARKIVRKLDLQPTVRFKLGGQAEDAKAANGSLGGIVTKDAKENSTK